MTMRAVNDPIEVEQVEAEPETPTTPAQILSRSGATAAIREVDGGERIQIAAPDGALLFDYDPASGRAVITVPAGNLVLSAPRGDVELVAGGSLRLTAQREVTLSGPRGVWAFGETTLSSLKANVNVENARGVFGRVETVASQIVQRAKNVFRRVEEVDDLAAGQQRSVVRGAYTLRSERAVIQAEDDVKIDGERIRLG